MASTSITKLARAAESGRRAVARVRERAKAQQTKLISQGEVVGGGALGGIIDATFGEGGADAEIMGLPMVVTAGALLTLAGMSEFKGSEHFGFAGVGLLAYGLGNFTREQFSG